MINWLLTRSVSHFTQSIIFSVLVFVTTGCGCNSRYGDIGYRPEEALLGIEFIDSRTGRNLYRSPSMNPAYQLDSIRLLNTTSNLIRTKLENRDTIFGIDSLYKASIDQIGRPVDKTFRIYFKRTDTDTVRVTFLPVNGKCEPYFSDYRVFYNNVLMTQTDNTIRFSIKVNKP